SSGNDLEFYLAGNVEIRQRSALPTARDTKTVRADEVYYDVNRNVAIALSAQLELQAQPIPGRPAVPRGNESGFVNTPDVPQLRTPKCEVVRAEFFSSLLPSDPGLQVSVGRALIEDKTVPRTGLFGNQLFDRTTGEPLTTKETIVTARNVFFEL